MEINNSHKNTKNNFVLGCANIHKSFGGLIALDNVSFSISKGIIVGVVGPNGAGKTTLFDVISGVTNLNSGKILFNDKIHTVNSNYFDFTLTFGCHYSCIKIIAVYKLNNFYAESDTSEELCIQHLPDLYCNKNNIIVFDNITTYYPSLKYFS